MLKSLRVSVVVLFMTMLMLGSNYTEPVEYNNSTENDASDVSLSAGITKDIYSALERKEDPHLTEGADKDFMTTMKVETFRQTLEKNRVDIVGKNNDEPIIVVKENEVLASKYVKASSLNMRKKPDLKSKVLTKIPFGTNVYVETLCKVFIDDVQQDQTWFKINYNDQVGYVASEYLVDNKPERSLGYYKITYYCPCSICCGSYSNGITGSGAPAIQGITIAADPSIPIGTKIRINGHIYTVQDRGGAIHGNHIDVFMNSHYEALQQTYTYGEVFEVID